MRAGIFKASESIDPMKIWSAQEIGSVCVFIISTSPSGYTSAGRVPGLPVCFAREDHCSSTYIGRASITPGTTIIPLATLTPGGHPRFALSSSTGAPLAKVLTL